MSISTKQVTDCQVHIGCLKNESHPKTSKYRAGIVNGLVVINPESIIQQIQTAREKIIEAKNLNKDILLVCEKKMYYEEIGLLAEKYGFNYLNYKVPAGFLTNFDTLKKRIDSMNIMSRFIESDDFRALTKKEKLVFKRKLERIQKIYKGVRNLMKKPDLVIVVDGKMMDSFLNELTKQTNIDSIIIAGTNFHRRWKEDSQIIANIGSHKSIDFVINNLFN